MKSVLAGSVALGLCASALALAATPAPAPPDFTGFFVRVGDLWFDSIPDDKGGKPIERLKLNRRDAEDIWAGDSANPILQPWARDIVKRNAEAEIRLQHVYTADDSCRPSGVPQAVNLLDEVQFLQTKSEVLILYQRDHQVRHVYLNVPHSKNSKPSWYGESVGRYEGDTLVVDTVGQNDKTVVDPFGTPHTGNIHVVERYAPFSTPFGKGIEVTVRVEDPRTFTMAWTGTAEYRENRGVKQLEEMVCAENDRSFAEGSTFGTIPEETKPAF